MAFEGQCGSCKYFKDKDNDCKDYDVRNARYEKGHCTWYGSYYWADENACRNHVDRNYVSGCYVTTIVCDILGYKDDNGVLNSLRSLRDNVMQKDKQYEKLLYEYDTVGPKIARKLSEGDNYELATALYNFYILPCALSINCKKYDDAINRYKEMTEGLKEAFGIEDEASILDTYQMEKGGHGYVYSK